MKDKLKNIITLILIFCTFVAVSQPIQIKFEHISLEQGLSQSSVSSIVQDENGFMWFGTLDGLNKYDGYIFKKYYSTKDTSSLPSNIITKIIKDNNEDLWIATETGICKYNKIKDNFIRIIDNKTQIQNKRIVDIKQHNNNLLIVTEQEFYKLDLSNNTITEIVLSEKITKDKLVKVYNYNDIIWLLTNMHLYKLDNQDNKFKIHDSKTGNEKIKHTQVFFQAKNKKTYFGTHEFLAELSRKESGGYNINIIHKNIDVKDISEDEHGILWIGTKNAGLFSYNSEIKRIINYKHELSNNYSLSVNSITSLYYSKAGIMWIGTELGGINKWNRLIEDIHVFKTNPFQSNSLSSNMIRSVFVDSYGYSWIGTVDKGLNLWLIDKKQFKYKATKLLKNKNLSISELISGDLWDVSKNEFKHFIYNPDDKTSIPNNHIRCIMETKDSSLWVGTDGGGIAKLNRKTWEFQVVDTNNSNLNCNKIWKIYQDSRDNFWVATNGGGLNLYNEKTKTFKHFTFNEENTKSISSNKLTTIFEDSKGNLWIGTLDNGLNRFNYSDSTFIRYTHNDKDTNSIPFHRVYSIFEDSQNNLWLGLKGCLSNFDVENNKFYNYTTDDGLPNNVVMGILEDENRNLWISTNNGICEFSKEKGVIRNFNVNDGLQSNEFLVGSFFKSKRKIMNFGGIGGLNMFLPSKLKKNANIPYVIINEFTIMNKKADIDTVISEKKEITINWYENIFSLGFVSLDYIASQENKYKIKLEGIDKDWVDYGTRRYVSYNNLPYGDYVFRVIGSNNDGVWNEEGASIIIHILPPWWETTWFKISVIIFLIVLILLWIKWRERKLKRDKRILEEKVIIRTKTIREQKDDIEGKNIELASFLEEVSTQRDEIEAQRDEIEAQRDTVVEQKDRIEEIHNEISQSISYATRLQKAILPINKIIEDNLSDNFVLFKPKDKVSGDYYWWTHLNNSTIITAADCTGHGVPGAFMSMLGISSLREIVIKEKETHTGTILNTLRKHIVQTLKQKGVQGEQKDGMDMALININHENNILQFSGANNSLYLIRNKKLTTDNENIAELNSKLKVESSKFFYEVKPDKMPIAIYLKMDDFATTEIQLEKGDQIYMFSDGFADQFGGPRGKKLMYKPFKRIILENADKPMEQQKEILNNAFEDWKGDLEQIDDVVVVGLKI